MGKKTRILFIGQRDNGVRALSKILIKEYPDTEVTFPEDQHILDEIMGGCFHAVIMAMDFAYEQDSTKQMFSWEDAISILARNNRMTQVFVVARSPSDAKYAKSKGAGFVIFTPINKKRLKNICDCIKAGKNGI